MPDTRIHECIRPQGDDHRTDKWAAASHFLEALPEWANEEDWDGVGHYFYWEWAGGWGEDYRRIYYCPICGVKLDD